MDIDSVLGTGLRASVRVRRAAIPYYDDEGPEMGVPAAAYPLEVPEDPTRVLLPRAASTSDASSPTNTCGTGNENLCEKPVGLTSSLTIPIVLGICIPVIGAISVLLYLHRRNVVRQRREDAADPHKGLDFGMGEGAGIGTGPKGKRKSMFGAEKMGARTRQLSMDLNMSTPYLLPPGLQSSRESLHSLARTLHQNEDPYRPIAQYTNSETGSIRSFQKGHEGSSVYTGSTANRRDSGNGGRPHMGNNKPLPPRQGSLPRRPLPAYDPLSKETSPSLRGQSPHSSPSPPLSRDHSQHRSPLSAPQVEALPYPEDSHVGDESAIPHIPEIVEPPPPAPQSAPRKGVVGATTPRPQWDNVPIPEPESVAVALGGDDIPLQPLPSPGPTSLLANDAPSHQQDGSQGLQADFLNEPTQLSPLRVDFFSAEPHVPKEPERPVVSPEPLELPRIEEPHAQSDFEFRLPAENHTQQDYQQQNYHPQDYPPQEYPQQDYPHQDYQQEYGSQEHGHHDQYGQEQRVDAQGAYENYDYQSNDYQDEFEYDRGRAQRRSLEFNHSTPQTLAVPQQDNKRLSVGFRPLPPDELMVTEDPEERANRIRSFYKEYFDEHKMDPHGQGHYGFRAQPPPPMPQHQPQVAEYYEDYDQSYAPEAFFDPAANAFVMPYAQPVTRRAMTPPPTASRFRGPPPPRAMHGSIGGMSLPGGRGFPRPGSSMSNRSNRWQGPARAGSAMSGGFGPRPGSSVSNRYGQPQNKKPRGPPPATLPTLPNPSKLKDDTFALMNAADFAPPESFQERARGRSQSPSGERRPYQLKVPIHSPLISSYDEMGTIPSPHLLRKSGTFTGLDFAPPKRFKENDTMSDAGSIRSNRSGISAVSQAALRNGAGRVSRLPGDTIFTQAASQDTLRPQWGMRP